MFKSTTVIAITLLFQSCFGQKQPLFRIIVDDKIGYINSRGQVLIKPRFFNGGEFSEGLAAVREDGLYGFIDETGDFAIKPQFDYATAFTNGLAVVSKDGNPFLIDKKGNTVLPIGYRAINLLKNKTAVVTTLSRKQGVIDVAKQKMLVDTAYSSIWDFKYGVALVYEYLKPSDKPKTPRAAVIDSTGKIIVPFGKYWEINPFSEGYAQVEIYNPQNKNDKGTTGFIDTKGALLFARPYKNGILINGNFHDGLAKINLYKYWIPEEKGVYSTSEKDYEGYINLKGEVVFNDTAYRYAKDFSNNRAFIKGVNEKFYLINKDFKVIGKNIFDNILNDTFSNGYAIVKKELNWGIIDTSGNYIIKPQFSRIDDVGVMGDYFFYAIHNLNDDGRELYGIADIKSNIILKPVMEDFDRNGFINGIIKAIVKGRLTYIDKSGTTVWQEAADTLKTLKKLNIDFMNRGYFYAYSAPEGDAANRSGGWAVSKNIPAKISSTISTAISQLSVIIETQKTDTFANTYFGYRLFIANTTNDTVAFNAQDSRLYMTLQAKNNKGEWRDIEYLPSSWCGNSYHTIKLGPNNYWKFVIPDYTGQFKTKIRAELLYVDKNNSKQDKVVYSNEIDGSINPAQFWNKNPYYPRGLMDPYND